MVWHGITWSCKLCTGSRVISGNRFKGPKKITCNVWIGFITLIWLMHPCLNGMQGWTVADSLKRKIHHNKFLSLLTWHFFSKWMILTPTALITQCVHQMLMLLKVLLFFTPRFQLINRTRRRKKLNTKTGSYVIYMYLWQIMHAGVCVVLISYHKIYFEMQTYG